MSFTCLGASYKRTPTVRTDKYSSCSIRYSTGISECPLMVSENNSLLMLSCPKPPLKPVLRPWSQFDIHQTLLGPWHSAGKKDKGCAFTRLPVPREQAEQGTGKQVQGSPGEEATATGRLRAAWLQGVHLVPGGGQEGQRLITTQMAPKWPMKLLDQSLSTVVICGRKAGGRLKPAHG